jgi:CDP-diacylglycerol--glycerol-3-phosphate 3-phosphatidyltransferase
MNIPNLLTVIRLGLVPVFIIVFFSGIPNSTLIAFLIFLAAGFTDVMDGYLARKYDMVTKWGSILDPLADKLMSVTVLVCLTLKNIIPLWVLYIIGFKEILMIVGAVVLFKQGTFVSAKTYGKAATVLFYIAVITLEFFYRPLGLMLMYVTALMALYALYKYFDNFIRVSSYSKK